jgi:hypothetical protein
MKTNGEGGKAESGRRVIRLTAKLSEAKKPLPGYITIIRTYSFSYVNAKKKVKVKV